MSKSQMNQLSVSEGCQRASFFELQTELRSVLAKSLLPPAPLPLSARPFVSVIILNYNGAAVLPNCLAHLKEQTYTNFEVIIFDNASRDSGIAAASEFTGINQLQIIRSDVNRGVAGGRNEALKTARGEVIAFIDNDGYADKDWLTEGLSTLLSSDEIGAVGSLVFFNRNKLVLNGAGGSQNRQWYAADNCFNEPFEFARLPDEILYPMGCGMIVKRAVLDEIGALDAIAPKWFDDTELGIRIWLSGKKVVLAPRALVEHDFHTSEKLSQVPPWRQALLFECMRVRNALKYESLTRLPAWLMSEFFIIGSLLGRLRIAEAGTLGLAYVWNLFRLKSLLAIRMNVRRSRALPEHVLHSSWGEYPPQAPANHLLPVRVPADGLFQAERAEDREHLHFGWFEKKEINGRSAVASSNVSSMLFLLANATSSLSLSYSLRGSCEVKLRRFGETSFSWTDSLNSERSECSEKVFALSVDPGLYEVLFFPRAPKGGQEESSIFAVSAICFR